jgi:hypothetical protein
MAAQGGKKGKTQGQIHAVFQTRLDDLAAQAKEQFEAAKTAKLRPWQLPVAMTTSLLDIESMHKPGFARDEINTNYEKVVQSPAEAGTVGDVIGLKQQIDSLAIGERAFRWRHSGVCRAIAHAMARRYGQGYGRVYSAMREQAENAIKAGGLSR